MKRPRREAITSHRDFPSAYADMVRRFDETHSITLGPMDHNAAISTRNQFYRYARWLRLAPPDDLDALTLLEVAQTMKCRIVASDNGHYLEWHESPLAEWARLHNIVRRYSGSSNK